MTERARLEVSLIDKVSRPAKKAASAVDMLDRKLGRTRRGGRARLPGDAGAKADAAARARAEKHVQRVKFRYFKEEQRKSEKAEKLRLRGALRQQSLDESLRRRQARETTRAHLRAQREREKVQKKASAKQARVEKERQRERQRSSEQATSRIKTGMLAVGSAVAALGAAYAALNIGIHKGAAESAIFAQNQRLAFDQLAKHGVSGAKLFDHARGLAEDFGLDVKETTKQYAKFLALQFNPQQADNLIKMGADMRVLGANAEDVKGVFLQLGQIKALGKVQMEELRPIMERGIAGEFIFEAMAKRMGKDAKEIPKLISAGLVSADIALPSIQDAIKKKLQIDNIGDAGKTFASTNIEGIGGRIKAKWDNLWIGLGQRTEKSFTNLLMGGLDRLDKWINSNEAEEFMDSLGSRIDAVNGFLSDAIGYAESFGRGLGSGANAAKPIGDLIDKLGEKETLENADDKFRKIGQAIGFIWTVTEKAIGAFDVFLEKIGALDAFEGFFKSIDKLDRWSTMMDGGFSLNKAETVSREVATSAPGALNSVLGAGVKTAGLLNGGWIFDSLMPDIGGSKAEMNAAGGELMQGMADGIKAKTVLPVDAMGQASGQVVQKSKEVFDSHSPSRVFASIGADTQTGFALGVRSTSDQAARATSVAGAKAIDGFTSARVGALGPPMTAGAELSPYASMAPMGRSGGSSSRVEININVESGTGDGDLIAEAIQARLEPALESLFDRYALAAG